MQNKNLAFFSTKCEITSLFPSSEEGEENSSREIIKSLKGRVGKGGVGQGRVKIILVSKEISIRGIWFTRLYKELKEDVQITKMFKLCSVCLGGSYLVFTSLATTARSPEAELPVGCSE